MRTIMMRASAIALTVLAAAAASGPIGLALTDPAAAQTTPPPGGDRRQDRVSPEVRARLLEGRLAMIKTALAIKPGDQERHWAGFEKILRESFAERQRLRAERERQAEVTNPVTRLEQRAQDMERAAARMKQLAAAAKPLYDSLDDGQKAVAQAMMRGGFGMGDQRGMGERRRMGPMRERMGQPGDRGRQ